MRKKTKEYEQDIEGHLVYRLGIDLSPSQQDYITIINIINKYTNDQFKLKHTGLLILGDITNIVQSSDGTLIEFDIQNTLDIQNTYDVDTETLICYLADDLDLEYINLMINTNLAYYRRPTPYTPISDYNKINIELLRLNKHITNDILLWLKLKGY